RQYIIIYLMKAFLYLTLLPALLPVFLVFRYVYKHDKIEPEPIGFVLKVMLYGALFALPCGFIEGILVSRIASIWGENTIEFAFYENFFGVALIEELSKLLAFRVLVWKNDNFNFRYDGIVYAVAASLGFAALENICYVMRFGTEVSIGRAIFSIPGHAAFGIFMGYYLSRAKNCALKHNYFGLVFFMIFAIAVPVAIHGAYDFLLSEPARNADYAKYFLVFVIILDILAWRKIKHEFRTDRRLGPKPEPMHYDQA
ncbi:MAG: PrsW family intramembrane metalloprotease, partial [Treponema sp.]|uniref:PrsW family glutamic-type intramembrane protease n=1 Tax=Treponema sp. TaxID=166 RepID=UPI00298EA7CC